MPSTAKAALTDAAPPQTAPSGQPSNRSVVWELATGQGHEIAPAAAGSLRCSRCGVEWKGETISAGNASVNACKPAIVEKPAEPDYRMRLAGRCESRIDRVIAEAQAVKAKLAAYQASDVARDLNDTVEITLRLTLETIAQQLRVANCPAPYVPKPA